MLRRRAGPVQILASRQGSKECLGPASHTFAASAATRSQLLAYQAAMVSAFLPAFLLSGFVFAIETMPKPIQVVTHIVPARYFIVILKGVFLKGIGLEILWMEFLLLAVYAVVVFLVTTRTLRRKVA